MKILCYLFLATLLGISCASIKNENAHYNEIKELVSKGQYSIATVEIMKFEESYPISRFLCELWNIQIATYKSRNSKIGYVRMQEDKYSKKCVNN